MPKHAYLSASSAARWMRCPKSVAATADMKDQPTSCSMEGTDCHELCAYLVEHALGRDVRDPTENLTYYNQEMQTCAEGYRDYVLEQVEEVKTTCKDPMVLIEQRLDFSKWVPDGFGTGDCVIVADGLLQIIDMKYGLGVLVHADDPDFGGNPQLLCYALGALDMMDGLYDIETVKVHIFQPRRDNISTYTISKEDLLAWAETVLAPKAKLAYEGNGEFHAGEHCRFCKIRSTCRERAEYNLELAKYDFPMPATLTDEEIAAILPRIEQLVSWGHDVKDYALTQAQAGTHFDGFKLVEGRSNRKYTDEAAVAAAVKEAGYDPYEQKLLSVTAMSSLLGRKQFHELLGNLVYKPPGKPALVPESDPRTAMQTAVNDFKDM